jgi:hypothetical protein
MYVIDIEQYTGVQLHGMYFNFTICKSFNGMFTVICMTGKRENVSIGTNNNSDFNKYDQFEEEISSQYEYTNENKSLLFMSVAIGALLAVFPLTQLLNRFGSRRFDIFYFVVLKNLYYLYKLTIREV